MRRPSRREFLALASGGLAGSLAGCTDAIAGYLGPEEDGEFVVVLANLRRPDEDGDDILARIDIENRKSERASGVLELELQYVPDGQPEATWTKTDDLDEPGGVSPQYDYLFESVYQPGSQVPDDYEIEAEIVPDE